MFCYVLNKLDTFPFSSVFSIRIVFEFFTEKKELNGFGKYMRSFNKIYQQVFKLFKIIN